MIPKALKNKLISYGWNWNWSRWHDVIIAYVSSYLSHNRRMKIFLTAWDRGDPPEVIAQRVEEMRVSVAYSENKIAEANS